MKKEIFKIWEYIFWIAIAVILFTSAARWLFTGQAYESSMIKTFVVIVQAIISYIVGGALICGFLQNYVDKK